jgi:hypothetical protein
MKTYQARILSCLVALLSSVSIAVPLRAGTPGSQEAKSSVVHPSIVREELAQQYAELLFLFADYSDSAVSRLAKNSDKKRPGAPGHADKKKAAGGENQRPYKEDVGGRKRDAREVLLQRRGFNDNAFWKPYIAFWDDFKKLDYMFRRSQAAGEETGKLVRLQKGWAVPFDQYHQLHQRLAGLLRDVDVAVEPLNAEYAKECEKFEKQRQQAQQEAARAAAKAASDMKRTMEDTRKMQSGRYEGRLNGRKLSRGESMEQLRRQGANDQTRLALATQIGSVVAVLDGPPRSETHEQLLSLRQLLRQECERLNGASRVTQNLPPLVDSAKPSKRAARK